MHIVTENSSRRNFLPESPSPKACRCEIVLYYAMNEDPWPIIAWSYLGRLFYNVAPHLVLNGEGAYKIASTWSCSEFQNN